MEIRSIRSYFADRMEGEENKAVVRMKKVDHNPEINGSEKHENS